MWSAGHLADVVSVLALLLAGATILGGPPCCARAGEESRMGQVFGQLGYSTNKEVRRWRLERTLRGRPSPPSVSRRRR